MTEYSFMKIKTVSKICFLSSFALGLCQTNILEGCKCKRRKNVENKQNIDIEMLLIDDYNLPNTKQDITSKIPINEQNDNFILLNVKHDTNNKIVTDKNDTNNKIVTDRQNNNEKSNCLLNNIHSKFVLNSVLKILNQDRQYKLFNYNKSFQKMLGITEAKALWYKHYQKNFTVDVVMHIYYDIIYKKIKEKFIESFSLINNIIYDSTNTKNIKKYSIKDIEDMNYNNITENRQNTVLYTEKKDEKHANIIIVKYKSLLCGKKDLYTNHVNLDLTDLRHILSKYGNNNFSIRVKIISNSSKFNSLENLFKNCKNIVSINLAKFNGWNITNMCNMCYKCSNLHTIKLSNFNSPNLTDMSYMFCGCKKLRSIIGLDSFNTSNVTNMSYMFSNCTSLTELNLSNLDTSNVTDMSHMFSGCKYLEHIEGFIDFNTENVTDMSYMFSECNSINKINLENFNFSKVESMERMFYECNKLKCIVFPSKNDINLTFLNTTTYFCSKNCIDMSFMFFNCYSLQNLDLSNFNTEKVTNMSNMFSGCSQLQSLDVSNFNTKNVINMNHMFSGCINLTGLNLSSFTSNINLRCKYMFNLCYKINYIDLSNFDINNTKENSNMFLNCNKDLRIIYNDNLIL